MAPSIIRQLVEEFWPLPPSQLHCESVVVFKIDSGRHSIPRDLLRSIPSSLSTAIAAVISSGNTRALDDAVLLVEQNTPNIKTLDVVFHMLIHGTSARHMLTTSTVQVKLGDSSKNISDNHEQVTLDFDLLADGIVLTTAISAKPVTDSLEADLTDEFRTVALTYEQFKKLFQSQNPVLQNFLVEWLFGFPRPGFRCSVCQKLVQKAMDLAGFPTFISRKMDELDHDSFSEAACVVPSEIYGHLPDEELRRELLEDVAEARQEAAVATNDSQQAKKRKAEHDTQPGKGKGVKFPKKAIKRAANTANTGARPGRHVPFEPAGDSSTGGSDLSVSEEPTPDREPGSSTLKHVSDKLDGSVAIDSHAAEAQGPPRKVVTLKYPARLAGRLAVIGENPATSPPRITAPTSEEGKAQENGPKPTDAIHPLRTSHSPPASGRTLWQQPKIGEKSLRDQPLYPPDEAVLPEAVPKRKANTRRKATSRRRANTKPKTIAPELSVRSKKSVIPPPAPTRVQPAREKKAQAPVKYGGGTEAR